MAWIVRSVLLALCVWLGEGVKKVKLADKAAEISVAVINESSNAVVNTTYIFGVFGYNSLTVPASGHLVHVRSKGDVNHGCSVYNHDLPTHDWVALIERGDCFFQDKIRMATKQYNATAVIIYDNQPTSELVMMQAVVTDEVYVFVTQSYGRRLALLVDSGLYVRVNIKDAKISSSPSCFVPHSFLSLLVSCLVAAWLVPGTVG